MTRKLRMGMIGGGRGAFIGAVHRMAAALDGGIELVCGAFASDPERSRASALELGIEPMRAYPHYRQMLEVESTLPDDVRMDFVTIVTPNHLHYEIARAALECGFDVVCEKPLTTTLAEALDLRDVVQRTRRLLAVTFNYTGYPLVKQAPWLRRYQIVQPSVDRVVVKIVPLPGRTPGHDDLQRLRAGLQRPLGSEVSLIFEMVSELPPAGNGKFRPYSSLVGGNSRT